MREVTAGPRDMRSLTSYQVNRTRLGESIVRKGHSWTCNEITHKLSSQWDQIVSEDSEKEIVGPSMESLTCCQVNRTRLKVRTVMRDTMRPGIKSLTSCQAIKQDQIKSGDSKKSFMWLDRAWNHLPTVKQANRIRLGVETVRRDMAEPGIKILTSYQVNRNKLDMRCENCEMWHSWAWHEITYLLSSQKNQMTVRKFKGHNWTGIGSPTRCQANRTELRVKTAVVRRDSWSWHEITHLLSSQ